MLDIKFVRANPDAVKENIKKKFQDEKLVLVDEVLELDQKYREAKTRCDYLRGQRNSLSKQIGGLMAKGQKEEAEKVKAQVAEAAKELASLEEKETEWEAEIKKRMTLRFPIMWILWSAFTGLTWTAQGKPAGTGFIIFVGILPGSILQSSLMQGIL